MRGRGGVRVHDGFPDYGKDFRRRLGIESEQALELFHQTVSMKAVGNLTDFVRAATCSSPSMPRRPTADIVADFEDLTKAHEAVRRAHAQLAHVTPLLKDCDAHDAVAAEIAGLTAKREAMRHYFADQKATLLEDQLQILNSEQARLTVDRDTLTGQLEDLRARETRLISNGLGTAATGWLRSTASSRKVSGPAPTGWPVTGILRIFSIRRTSTR